MRRGGSLLLAASASAWSGTPNGPAVANNVTIGGAELRGLGERLDVLPVQLDVTEPWVAPSRAVYASHSMSCPSNWT